MRLSRYLLLVSCTVRISYFSCPQAVFSNVQNDLETHHSAAGQPQEAGSPLLPSRGAPRDQAPVS
jgi:hypothetical protein